MSDNGKCLRCGKWKIVRPRGLCRSCYETPGVRKKYPPYCPNGETHREPTMAELDAMVAEQMQCLPAWWHKESGR